MRVPAQRLTLRVLILASLLPNVAVSLHTWGTEVPSLEIREVQSNNSTSSNSENIEERPVVVGDLALKSEDPQEASEAEHGAGPVIEELPEPPAYDGPLTPREEWLKAQNNQLLKRLASMRVSKVDILEEHGEPHAGSTQHHTLDPTTPAVSVMLLGAIAFQMALFYLVNWPDEDIQYYAYHVIGRSISIFISVLIFDAVHDIIEFYFKLEEPGSGGLAILAAAIQMFAWFIIMQLVTAEVSGAMPWSQELPEPEEVKNERERAEIEDVWKSRKIGLKCWSGLLTHVTAFASISTWSRIQQGIFFNQSFWTAILVVPISFVAILLLYQGADWVRYVVAMYGDGKISASEELWDETSEEAENDVMAMALSFTTVQAFQFWFLGKMPDEKGTLEVEAPVHWGMDCIFLAVIAILCSIATFVAFRLASRLCAKSKSNESLKTRMSLIFMNYTSICFAWCLFFSIKAFVHWVFPHVHTEALTAKIVIALAVSLVSFMIIFVLDFIADRQAEGSEEQRAFAKIILAKGLLIGFSWEGCFATAFHSISHGFGAWVKVGNLGLSICLCIVVIPAYRRYILPEMSRRLDVQLAHHKLDLIEVS